MALLLFLLLSLASPAISHSADPQDEYKALQEKMEEQKKKISTVQKRESDILSDIETVNRNLGTMESELRKYRRNLAKTQSEVRTLNSEIEKTRKNLEKQKDWIKRKLRVMQRFGNAGDVAILLLNAEDISQAMRTWKYLEAITVHEHKVLGDYRQNLQSLDHQHQKLRTLEETLRENAEKVKQQERALTNKKKSKEIILSSVRDEKKRHQKMLKEMKEASQRLLELIREAEKTDRYGSTGFQGLKGRLVWPTDGEVAISYGQQRDPQFDTPVFRNGIHIAANAQADVKSVHKGKVIFAEWFKGFGQLVIINHGSGYHTLYGNLSEIFSQVGDIINDNQVIGKVGTSGILNAPGLYFEVRYKGKPLDPLQWLKKRRR